MLRSNVKVGSVALFVSLALLLTFLPAAEKPALPTGNELSKRPNARELGNARDIAPEKVKTAKADPDRKLEVQVLEVAMKYKDWGRVDDETRWAPTACRAPWATSEPSVARFSKSDDKQTHGRKLYFLYSNKDFEYRDLPSPNAANNRAKKPVSKEVSVGMTIVKESWKPEEVPAGKNPDNVVVTGEKRGPLDSQEQHIPYATRENKLYHAKEQAELFIMHKLDPKTPGTDEGWIYATVTPDGKKILSIGKIESCMNCHQDAPHDRLFGLAKADKNKNAK